MICSTSILVIDRDATCRHPLVIVVLGNVNLRLAKFLLIKTNFCLRMNVIAKIGVGQKKIIQIL